MGKKSKVKKSKVKIRKKKTLEKQKSKVFPPIKLTTKRIIAAILILAAGFFFLKLIVFQVGQANESPRHLMRKIPEDVKRAISKQNPAGISATLRVPILMYHYVEYVQDKKDTIRQTLNINPNVFDEEMKTLVNAGYTFMTARELGAVIDGRARLPKNPILITFDDGHWDLDTVILPILKKYNVRATAYIIPGFLGGSDFLSREQLQDVINSGLVEIGAHTVHHVALKAKFLPVVQYEVKQSKKMLEDEFHLKVVSFAYPAGSFDEQAINVVESAGYTNAVSTIPGIAQNSQNRFFLYRLRPGYRTGEELLNYLNQVDFKPW